jgi:bifunctional NMN adenylyltransferase/nudix hydrolase
MGSKVGVVIGRFRGFHKFHMDHIIRAASENDRVMILIGSSNRRVSIKNPFTYYETVDMIEANVQSAYVDGRILSDVRIVYRPLIDEPYDNDAWADRAKQLVHPYVDHPSDVTVYGCDKDASTFYYKLFPEWKQSLTEVDESDFCATRLREAWFEGLQTDVFLLRFIEQGFISRETADFMDRQLIDSNLQKEWHFYQRETERFKDYPFPETLTFNCGDAIVRWQDEILFIVRGAAPGKGCLALAGGFKNRNETFAQAAERELYEEARLNIPPDVLAKCKVKEKLFDDPSRSLGIPRATLAVLYDVTAMFDERPEVYPADDAVGHRWVKINALDDIQTESYDDHVFMVKEMLK